MDGTVKRYAIIDPSGQYRYMLLRWWNQEAGLVTFVMLNPSTADAVEDDPTIRRCIQFAKDWGYGGVVVVNLFAFRSTDPNALMGAADPIGPDNDQHIAQAVRSSKLIVCAWGSHKAVAKHKAQRDRIVDLIKLCGEEPMCLKLSKKGEPYHPLYLRSDTQPFPLEKT